MSIGDWYDREGNPIDTLRWGELHEDYDYVRVELTEIGPYVVSTVWLGLDHSYMEGGPPIIFESLVFTKTAWEDDTPRDDPNHEPLMEIDGMRYSTEDEARKGHMDLCTLIRATYVEDPYETPSDAPSDPEK